jgi:hypothetical protein
VISLALYGFNFEIVCRDCNTALSAVDAHANEDGTFAAVCGGCGHAGHLDRHTIERMVINACNGDMGFKF